MHLPPAPALRLARLLVADRLEQAVHPVPPLRGELPHLLGVPRQGIVGLDRGPDHAGRPQGEHLVGDLVLIRREPQLPLFHHHQAVVLIRHGAELHRVNANAVLVRFEAVPLPGSWEVVAFGSPLVLQLQDVDVLVLGVGERQVVPALRIVAAQLQQAAP